MRCQACRRPVCGCLKMADGTIYVPERRVCGKPVEGALCLRDPDHDGRCSIVPDAPFDTAPLPNIDWILAIEPKPN